jgi:hypothetical protein
MSFYVAIKFKDSTWSKLAAHKCIAKFPGMTFLGPMKNLKRCLVLVEDFDDALEVLKNHPMVEKVSIVNNYPVQRGGG